MKFIWEETDFDPENNWGLMASRGEELVIIGGLGVTSLRDGHQWTYDSAEVMASEFNKHGYTPVLAPINPSVIIRKAESQRFNYGK
jgi:hypothetical protein